MAHEGLVPEHPTPCPEEPAMSTEGVPALFVPPVGLFVPPVGLFVPPVGLFVPPVGLFVPPLPATLVKPPLPALPAAPLCTGSLLIDPQATSVALTSSARNATAHPSLTLRRMQSYLCHAPVSPATLSGDFRRSFGQKKSNRGSRGAHALRRLARAQARRGGRFFSEVYLDVKVTWRAKVLGARWMYSR